MGTTHLLIATGSAVLHLLVRDREKLTRSVRDAGVGLAWGALLAHVGLLALLGRTLLLSLRIWRQRSHLPVTGVKGFLRRLEAADAAEWVLDTAGLPAEALRWAVSGATWCATHVRRSRTVGGHHGLQRPSL